MKRWYWGYLTILTILLWSMGASLANAALPNDAYIAGYAAAIVERDFKLPQASLSVQDGVVRLRSDDVSTVDRTRLMNTLGAIPGVVRVELLSHNQVTATVEGQQRTPLVVRHDRQQIAAELSASPEDEGFLPQGYLFDQLSADVRWPHFSVAYRYHINDKELGSTGAANFGETFSLYRTRAPFGGRWEVGLQGGVFSFFDLTRESKDLVNADYMGGIFGSYRYKDFSTMLRLFHQSSHLGDEFLLRNRVRRINLSYEQVDLRLSYKFFDLLRLYGGGGYLFDQEPANIRPWITQYGIEIESPWKLRGTAITPIVAGDFKNDEEDHWSTNISLRGGFQFENWRLNQRRLQLLIEYFRGHSPNGQFYNRKIETIGIGAHLRY
jgi:hypothetical protein